MTDKIATCLWFDGNAREAAESTRGFFPTAAST